MSKMSEKMKTSILKYYPSKDGYFVYRFLEKSAQIVTYEDFKDMINKGRYDYENGKEVDPADHTVGANEWESREETYTGSLLLIKNKPIPVPESAKSDMPPSGLYTVTEDDNLGTGIVKYKVSADDYIDLDNHTRDIQEEIESFMVAGKEYKDMGLLHKRGILLYGPPGTGKTRLVEHLVQKYSDRARIMIIPAGFRMRLLGNLKEFLSDMPTIFVLEEITTNIDNENYVASLLGFLDGEESWDRCLTLATTNYPQKLPGNIVDRPSRFDNLYKIDVPAGEVRKIYLAHLMGAEAVTERLVKITEGMSLAHLKELSVAVKINKKNAEDIIRSFMERKKKVKADFAEAKQELGFGRGGGKGGIDDFLREMNLDDEDEIKL